MTQNSLNIISENSRSTVVTEFTPTKQSSSYQSESDLEHEFIKILQSQAYEYITIKSEDELKSNLRTNLEKLNDYKFSDDEWSRFFNSQIANQTSSIEDKTLTIQKDYKKVLKRDDGSDKNIYLIYKESEKGEYNIHKNHLQVINQYNVEDGSRANRYDVTILVNGLPLVHIELKRR